MTDPQKLIRVKRKLVGHYVIVTPTWISNAYWAIRRDRVKNAALLATKELAVAWLGDLSDWREKTDADIGKFFDAPAKAFTVTRLVVRANYYEEDARLLVADGDSSWLRDDYLRMLGIQIGDVLYAEHGQKPMREAKSEADSTFVLMPMKMETEQIAAQMRRWLTPDPPQAGTVHALRDMLPSPAASAAP